MTANETMSKELKIDLTALEAILDIYGSDRSRWPQSSRPALENFIDENKEAHRLLKEAQALDRVMNTSSSFVAGDALKAKIMASVASDTSRSARVVPITAVKSARDHVSGMGKAQQGYWPAAALAASFAFGLYLGIAGLGSQAFEGAVQVSGLASVTSDTENLSWLDDGSLSALEDIL